MRTPTKLNLFVILFFTLMTIISSIIAIFYSNNKTIDLEILIIVCIVFIPISIISVKAYLQYNEDPSEIEMPSNFSRIVTYIALLIALGFSGFKLLFYIKVFFRNSNAGVVPSILVFLELFISLVFIFSHLFVRAFTFKKNI